ncbi:unnamed protein product [Penicillium discolor]
MTSRIVVTGGAIIRDDHGRILLQRRSDYGDWGLPGGGMEPGERIEETMIREVKEETGLDVISYELASIYTDGKLAEDGRTLYFEDENKESLQLTFTSLDEIEIDMINKVQRPTIIDLIQEKQGILR